MRLLSRADDAPRVPGNARRPSLLAGVAVISMVVVVGIGIVLGIALQGSVRSRAISDAARTGEVAANVGARPFLDVADLERNFMPLPDERVDALDASLGTSLSPNGIVRIKVWNRQHWLVYSDNPKLRGRWFAGAEILERSFEGELTTEITDLSAPEEREERDFGELLAVYVPLRTDGEGQFTSDEAAEVIGAFEIYLPWAPIAEQIRADTAKLWLTLGAGLILLYVALFQLVASASRQLQKKSAQNLYFATHDTLTGLANRDAFHRAITSQLANKRAGDSSADVVLFFDLDDFQIVNDTLGHDVGDKLLQLLGERLGLLAGEVHVGSRLGGDEFGLLLANIGQGDVESTVDFFGQVMNTTVDLGDIPVEVTASVGVVPLERGTSADVVLQRADIAMYEAKKRRSHLEYFHPAMDTFSSESLALAGEIRAGIENDEFVLVYQPKYSLDNGVITGSEALVRWNRPDRGQVPPSEFMAFAERMPVGQELTNCILALAVAELADWTSHGLEVGVSVNLSARDVNDPRLAPYVETLLKKYDVEGRLLTLELTEGSMLADEGRTIATLSRLRELGCGVAIDDFGTGYAALSYLVRLPATEVKIDRSFITALNEGQRARKIVEHSVGLARSLGMSVTAEGIETPQIEQMAKDLGCDTGQGYLRGAPMEAHNLRRLFEASAARAARNAEVAQESISAEDARETDTSTPDPEAEWLQSLLDLAAHDPQSNDLDSHDPGDDSDAESDPDEERDERDFEPLDATVQAESDLVTDLLLVPEYL